MVKKYRVELGEEERQVLKALVSRGRAAAYRQTHARILLLSDENQAEGPMKDEEIARSLKVGRATVERVRRRCVEEGLERALGRKEQLNRPSEDDWMVRERPTWWRWPAANHRRGGPVGLLSCWRTGWWNAR